ncbi:MAG: glycosyltransferase [Candidatus Rifleibacteriota bacterium]
MSEILYSFIVPAYNEEELLGRSLTSIKNSMSSVSATGELVVVDNASTDRTAEIAREFGAKVIRENHRQIARARNAGAAVASGRYLFFVDADTCISGGLLREALRQLQSGKVIGGGAKVEMDVTPPFIWHVLLKFWQTISRAARLAAGCFVFCRASAFFSIGGFDERVYASEEIGLSIRLRELGRKQKRKFVILDMPGIKTSGRKNSQYVQLILSILVFSIFPAAVRFRSLCFLWYACRNK